MVDLQPSRSQRRAVIIDDEPAFVAMLTKMLETYGFEVKVSTDTRTSQTYEIRDTDIVFVDAQMPHVSGSQVLEQLARQGTKSYVVAMSGDPLSLNNVESLAKKLDLNLVGVLEKPFRVNDLKLILDGP
jgi:DNA-binding NtrC family response regulator